jgi:hypothetical protein
MPTFDYAPAPESRRRRPATATACSSTASSSTASGTPFKTVNPATEEVLAEIAEASADDVDRGRRRAHGIHPACGRDVGRRPREVPLPDRAHPAGAGPRVRRAGDPRQRQADQGEPRRRRAARGGALLLPRRLGRQARVCRSTARTRAPRRRRAGHPVELPAAHARVEDRPGAGLRQHRGAQAGRDHAADGAALRRGLPAGRPAARASSTSSPAPAPPGRPSSTTRASTRSPSPARPRSAR